MSRLFYIGLVIIVSCAATANRFPDDDELSDGITAYADSSASSSSSSEESEEGSSESDSCFNTTPVLPPPPPPPKNDELKCGPNESVDDCPVDCPSDYCPRSEEESNRSQICIKPKVCRRPACKCNFNHRRARNGTCIPTRSCPPFRCSGINEEFNPCPPLCPTDDCSQASPTGKCPAIGRIGIVLNCTPKCRCKKGYWRKHGICVPYEECSNPRPDNPVCGVNEEIRCVQPCPPQFTCRRRVNIYACPIYSTPCKKTCVCKQGYLRNSIGQCISTEQCDKCTKPNEFYSCGSACDNECETWPSQNRTNCPIINIKCNEKCYCDDGYARDDNGDCIPVDQCKPKCGENEVEKCVKKCPLERTCDRPIINYACIKDPTPCQNKCVCADGYLRNPAGKCVLPKQCPLQCGKNEVEKCVKKCPFERTCRRRFINYLCKEDQPPCQRKCVCADGYFRNSIGECISAKQCDKCKKPNEFFSCGKACDNDCEILPYQNRTNCPTFDDKCIEKCYCDDGYARDKKGDCIPVKKCKPTPLNCGPLEVEVCSYGCPPTRTCENRRIAYRCARPKPPCKRKCVCKSGYYKNAIGECITEKECAKCSKPNEFFSCGSACDNECKTIKTQSRLNCPIKNIVCNKKCYCKDGFARDDKGNCIPIDKCSPPCSDPNEEYVLGKSCPPDQCIALVAKFKCDSNEEEKYRCRCKSGFFRVKAGSPCVPVCECPQMANSPECSKDTE